MRVPVHLVLVVDVVVKLRGRLIDHTKFIALFLTVAQDLRQCLDTRFIPCTIMHQQHHHFL